MDWNKQISQLVLRSLLLLSAVIFPASILSLTLHQAEQSALKQAPELQALRAKTRALKQSAIAANQLVDPKLMINAMNVPVNTFNFSQVPMTQVQLGLQQSIPRGQSLHYQSLQKLAMSRAEYQRERATKLFILREVRLDWLNLYVWLQTKRIVNTQKKVFSHLVKVTESMLANNKTQQKDVIRAHLELVDINNRLININQQIDIARVQLKRWIGSRLAQQAHPKRVPTWSNPSATKTLLKILKRHPELKTDAALIDSSRASLRFAEQQYKPGYKVTLAYGFRQEIGRAHV